jgi:hypothetical protein
MLRRSFVAVLAVTLGSIACSESEPDLPEPNWIEPAALDADLMKERAAMIRDAALAAGVTSPVLIAGVAAHESGGLHFCHDEGMTSCPGPASPDCDGGPILAGDSDGACEDKEGGLGFFQFDAGTYSDTLNAFGNEILTINGNTRAGIDFIVHEIRISSHTPDLGPFTNPDTQGLANALEWLNSVELGGDNYDEYLTVLADNYNGCSVGCTYDSCNCDHNERKQSYHLGIQSMLALGEDFWNKPENTEPEPPPTDDPPAPTDGITLPFSWEGQQTYYWCGPASTRIALSVGVASPPSQNTLAMFMGTTTAGTDHIGLVRDALNYYWGTSWFETKDMYDPPTQAQRDLLKADILLNLGNGYPIVANVWSGWRPPGYPPGEIFHYVAVVGYADGGETVLIADPAAEGHGGSSWGNVPQTYWISLWDLGTWIGGKGYSA